MHTPLRLLLMALAGVQFANPATACLPQDDSLFKEFGNLLGNALRGIEGPDAAPAMMAAPEFAGGREAGAVPTEKEQAAYQTRITAFSIALQEWVISTCELSEEQRATLKQEADQLLEKDVTAFAAQRDANHGNSSLPKTAPILFTLPNGLATKLATDLMKAAQTQVLTPDQQLTLDKALDERLANRNTAFARFLVAMIDRELFLTTEQSQQLMQRIESAQSKPLHPLYAFQPQSYYMPYESLASLVDGRASKDTLDRLQRDRLTDLQSQTDGGSNLTFMSNTGPEEWSRQITEAGRKGQQMMSRAVSVRVAWMQRELKLTDSQCERLRTAGKGASVQAVDDWKESAQQTITQMEQQMAQFQGNFGFGTQALDVRSLDANPVWSTALVDATKLMPAGQVNRDELLRKATADSVTALLDAELWLTPEQKKSLHTLVLQSLPKSTAAAQQQEYIRELVLIAHPLFMTDETERNRILNDAQREVWKQMQSLFQFQKDNNIVQIQLQNNGGSFGFMLQRE